MRNRSIDVHPISPNIGALVQGVDLGQSLDDQIIGDIRGALLDHQVIFFEDQEITPEQHIAFASRFGEIEEPHPVFGQHATDPRMSIIESRGRPGDDDHEWHTDVSYQKELPLGSILHAQIIPESGGDTLFTSMYAAYESLSGPMKQFLSGLTATHSFELGWGKHVRRQEGGDERMRELNSVFPPMTHPVVRTHPETGRKGLFVNKYYTTRISELSQSESATVLEMLFRHCTTPEFQVRYTWRVHDIAFWDNRVALHYGSRDYGAQHRLMHRVTLAGDQPY